MSASSAGALEVPCERFELPGGLILLVSPRPGAPITAARLHLRGGSSVDPAGQEGRAFLAGRLADQGTATSTEADLSTRLEPCGGSLTGDQSGLSGSVAGPHWKVLLETLFEVARGAAFPEAEVEVQRRRMLARMAVEEENPRSQASLRFKRLVYGRHWLGRPAHGTVSSVGGLTPEDLRAHHAAHWGPDRAVLGICGDLDPQAVRRLVARLTKGWSPVGPIERKRATLPSPGVRLDAFSRSRDQVHVYLGHLGVRRADPDWPTLVVMDHVLGSGPGFTARITKRLRDELGLAYSVHADIHGSAGRLPGTFRAYIGTSPEHVGTAIQGFLEEMRRIRDARVTRKELNLARDYLVGSFPLGFERAARRAGYLITAELHGYAPDHLQTLPQRYASVTAAEVQAAAQRHLHPDACCVAAAGPVTKAALKRALEG